MAEEISLLPDEPAGQVNLTEDKPAFQDESVVRSRVQKADYALGEHSPGQEVLNQTFWLGMDEQVRRQAALASAVDARRHYNQTAQDLVQQAALEGRPLSQEEQAYLLDRPVETDDEKTALEARFAKRALDEAVDPEGVYGGQIVPEEARSIVTKQQIALRVLEDFKAQYDETSWLSWGVDFAKGLVPFYDTYKLHNVGEDLGSSSYLAGNNMAEQIRGLYLLPASEFEDKLKEITDTLRADNNILALQYLQNVIEYSDLSQILDSAFTALDTVDVATLGGAVIAKNLAKGGAKRITKDLTNELKNSAATRADVKVVSGKAEEAAKDIVQDRLGEVGMGASKNVIPVPSGTRPEKILNDLAKNGMGLADPEIYTRRAGHLTNEAQRRLIENLENNREILKSSLTDVTHIVRISDEAAQVAFNQAEKDFRRQFYRLEDSIAEVMPVRESVDVFGGVDRIEVLVGKKNALPFKSAAQAENYAKNFYKLPEGGYSVAQKGQSYFLKMEKTVDETDLSVLDMRLSTGNQAPETFVNTWIGLLRNPDDIRSPASSARAKVATYGANAVMSKMSEVAKSIGVLGKNESSRLSSVLDSARFKWREVIDVNGEKVRVQGVFYKDVADLEKAYLAKGYPMPSEKEVNAYFSFRQLMDYDHAVRNISVYRDKARKGIDQKSVSWIVTDETGKKTVQKTPFFEGKTLDALPDRSGAPFTLGWYDNKTGKASFGVSNRLFPQQWQHVDELLQKDYKIIHVADSNNQGLKNAVNSRGEPVEYLIVKDMDSKPLSSVQVPYNEGGHWNYSTVGTFLKQPQTSKTGYGRRLYNGDVTAHHFTSSKDGERFAKAYETARQMLKSNDKDLDTFLQSNLPYDAEEFRKLFRSKDNPDGAFDIDTPFFLTRSGQSVSDVTDLRSVFRDREFVESSEHNLLSDIHSRYTQERGQRLTSIRTEGTEQNPVFKLQGAPLMEPLESLTRSTAQLAKSRFFDDFKHASIEDWVTQFADVVDAPIQSLRADPLQILKDPKWRKDVDTKKLAAAKNTRRNLIYLLQTESPDIEAMKWTRQKMIDTLTSLKGDKSVIDPFKWESHTDPAKIGRSFVFHMKLGMFNAVQFPLQAQSVIHAAAIDGSITRAAQANYLYSVMRGRAMADGNKGAQGFFGKAASKALGVPSEQVEELYRLFKETGMNVVEGEYARLDDYLNPKQLFGSDGVRKGLDAATVFFKEGNLYHRGVSFATSYLRFRAENPLKKIDARDVQKIVDRADLYYVNMSRASNNDILAGRALSVPAQFMTYHKNLMEQLLGGRLTGVEKARMLSVYSAFYGLPIGAGLAAAPIWPVSDSIRQYALEQGLDMQDDLLTNFIMNGAASVALEMLTGDQWNVADRYGPGGLDLFRDLLEGNLFEAVGGASGSSVGDFIERVTPFGKALVDSFTGGDRWQLTSADFLDAAREISSVNNAMKAWYAVTSSQILTKSDSPVMDFSADAADAVLIGAFGLTLQEASDAYLKIRSGQQDAEVLKQASVEIKKQFRRAAKASADGNREQAEAYYKRVFTLVEGFGLTPLQRSQLFKEAMRDNKTLLDKVDRNFMLRDPEKRFQQYRKNSMRRNEDG